MHLPDTVAALLQATANRCVLSSYWCLGTLLRPDFGQGRIPSWVALPGTVHPLQLLAGCGGSLSDSNFLLRIFILHETALLR